MKNLRDDEFDELEQLDREVNQSRRVRVEQPVAVRGQREVLYRRAVPVEDALPPLMVVL